MTKDQGHDRVPFTIFLARGTALVLLATAIASVLHHTWFLRKLELANLDALFVLSRSRAVSSIALVEISDDDYKDEKMFGAVSPLKPALVGQIIEAIDAAGGRVIGVDILTTEWPPNSVANLKVRAPVVWVRDLQEIDGTLHLEPIMSGDGEDLCQGPPALQRVDGLVRMYFREVRLPDESTIPSFTSRLGQVAGGLDETCRGRGSLQRSGGQAEPTHYISFIEDSSAFQRFSASAIIAGSQSPEWSRRRLMKDRIVLLGGAYKQARDRYVTPLGEMYGVEILANILDSEMTNRTVKEAGVGVFIIADVLLGFSLIAIAYYVPRPWSLPAIFFGAPVTAVTLNIFFFHAWRYYLSFMPVAAGVIVHSIVEHVHEHRRLLREHAELESRHATLQIELAKLRSLQVSDSAAPGRGSRSDGTG